MMQNIEERSKHNESRVQKVLLNLEDYHQEAKLKLPKAIYDFYSTGSDDRITLNDNRQAYHRIKLRPKVLVNVSSHLKSDSLSCSTQILNSSTRISFPCMIAPTSFHRLANNEHGELATVRAAVACSTILCVSTAASIRMEIIVNEHRKQIQENYPQSQSQLWYQLYIFKNRQYSQNLIRLVEKHDFKALVITVDTCKIGNRECDIRNNFSLPDGIQSENLLNDSNNSTKNYRETQFDPSLSWKDIQWVRSITSLPIILKGILHPDDAREAARQGVQGIIVSNHGGRQLDTSLSTIEALPDIIKAVQRERNPIDVYIDGGIRRGTDILKAVALGAKAVLIGRPILWGLAVDGEQGVKNVLEILKKEFQLALMLSGCATVDDVRKNNLLVMHSIDRRSKL